MLNFGERQKIAQGTLRTRLRVPHVHARSSFARARPFEFRTYTCILRVRLSLAKIGDYSQSTRTIEKCKNASSLNRDKPQASSEVCMGFTQC